MIEHDVPQGENEWLHLRLGVPTASQFFRILTPSQLKPSKQADAYMDQLLAEWKVGEPLEELSGPWFDRGHELEDAARSWYEFTNDVEVRQVGFVTSDDGLVGCSPDGLVGDDGGFEAKAYNAAKHMSIVRHKKIPPEAYMQCAGGLWLCEREWWDFTAYNPVIDPVVIRVERDENYIKALSEAVLAFVDELESEKQKMSGA